MNTFAVNNLRQSTAHYENALLERYTRTNGATPPTPDGAAPDFAAPKTPDFAAPKTLSFAAMLKAAPPKTEDARQAADIGETLKGKRPPDGAAVSKIRKGADFTADKLYEQCEALETFVVKSLITGMRKTVEKSKLIDTGFSGEIYEDMLYDEYTKSYTKNANFGLAELAYLELTGQRGKVVGSE